MARQIEEPTEVVIGGRKRLIDADCAGHPLTQAEVESVNAWHTTAAEIDAYRARTAPKCRTCNDTGYVVKVGYGYVGYREACPDCPPQLLRAAGAL